LTGEPSPAQLPIAAPEDGRAAWLRRLSITDFRNYARLDLTLDDRPVVLFGSNGSGKTNILEAISLLGPGRGIRGAALSEIGRRQPEEPEGRAWASSAILVNSAGDDTRLGVGLERTDTGGFRRVAQRDGRPAGPQELASEIRIVWLTPAMDRVFAESASERRKFFDRLVMAHAPEHGAVAAAYERAMKARQRLLDEDRRDRAWLEALEQEMAAHGVALAAARLEVLGRLQTAIDARGDGPFPQADLALEGVLEAALAEGKTAGEIEDEFIKTLASVRPRDAAAGRALDGPHRSDVKARHRAKNMPAEQCSTGEQKAILVAVTLANARSLGPGGIGLNGRANPLLLLDEAGAHFDDKRRAALYNELAILPGQAWLTGADKSLFDSFAGAAQFIEVSDGKIRPL
jgi:DNA replication and repair protein RecF